MILLPKVGAELIILKDIVEEATGDAPGCICAKKGDKVIVRRLSDHSMYEHYIHVSHEDRTDGSTFGVGPSEVGPWAGYKIIRFDGQDPDHKLQYIELYQEYWSQTGDMRTTGRQTYDRMVEHHRMEKSMAPTYLPETMGYGAVDEKGKLLGFCLVVNQFVTSDIRKAAYISDLYTAEKYRRQGIAKALMKEVFEFASKNDLCKVYWVARQGLEVSGYYQKLTDDQHPMDWFEVYMKGEGFND